MVRSSQADTDRYLHKMWIKNADWIPRIVQEVRAHDHVAKILRSVRTEVATYISGIAARNTYFLDFAKWKIDWNTQDSTI